MSRAPTAEELQYMMTHVSDDTRGPMIASSAIGGLIAILCVVLRIMSRKMPGIPLKADDWWMVASLILYLGTPICFAWTTKYGAGRHVVLLSDPKAFAMLLLICEILYFSTIFTIKVSLLYLYRRIFPQLWFRRALYAFGAFLVAMTLASLLVSLLQCIPLSKMWEPTKPGRCVDYGRFGMAMACLNIATDLFLLVLPLPVVWGLQINSQKKWLVSASFVMGGSACIVCLVRLLFVLRVASTPDPTWDSIPSGITSTIELCVGIFAASFPTYRPLFKKISEGTSRLTTKGGSNGINSIQGRPHARSASANQIVRLTTITKSVTRRNSDEEGLYVRM